MLTDPFALLRRMFILRRNRWWVVGIWLVVLAVLFRHLLLARGRPTASSRQAASRCRSLELLEDGVDDPLG